MPRAAPLRGEKLPKLMAFLRKSRRDFNSPVGTWEVDAAISAAHQRGAFRRLQELGVDAYPHGLIRQRLMDCARNAYQGASDIYRGRDTRTQRAAILARAANIARLLEEFGSAVADDNSALASQLDVIADTRQLIQSLTTYQSEIASDLSNPAPLHGNSANFLNRAFVFEVSKFWLEETGNQPARPFKGLVIDLAVGIWKDACLPDHSLSTEALRTRITKWFA